MFELVESRYMFVTLAPELGIRTESAG